MKSNKIISLSELEVLIANFVMVSVPVDGEAKLWSKFRKQLVKRIDINKANVWK